MFLVNGEIKMNNTVTNNEERLEKMEHESINFMIAKVIKISKTLSDEDRVILMSKLDNLISAFYDEAVNDEVEIIRDIRIFLEDK